MKLRLRRTRESELAGVCWSKIDTVSYPSNVSRARLERVRQCKAKPGVNYVQV